MKLANANAIRTKIVADLFEHMSNAGEDCGLIASNSFNLPVVVDGEEGWVEVVVKVPKEDGDEGFGKREEYSMKLAANAERQRQKPKPRRRKSPRTRRSELKKRRVNPPPLHHFSVVKRGARAIFFEKKY